MTTRRLSSLWLTACMIFALANPSTASLALKPAKSNPGRWTGGSFPDTSFEGIHYVSVQFLENLFGKEGSWIPDRQKFVLADSAGRKWSFTVDNPYISIGEEVFNLGFPVRRGPEFLFLPLPSLIRTLKIVGYGVDLADPLPATGEKPPPQAAAAETLPGGANILDLGAEERDNGTLVTIRTAGKLTWDSFWVPPHFILKFQGGHFSPQVSRKIQGQGLVNYIQTMQEDGLAQVTLYIPKAIDTAEVSYSPESLAYQVLVRKKNSATNANASSTGASDAKAKDPKAAGKNFGTIIIDPGHGGKDQGAQVAGVNEAPVTLAVAKELQTALKKMGFKALLTRENDSFVELKDRPKFASEQGGDLFISLHCNSIGGSPNRKKSITGFTAYILREGESEEDKTLARRENQAISEGSGKSNKTEITPVEWILLEHQLNLYSKESEAFADMIVKAFDGNPIGKYATGAGQAGFYVLVGAYMPAVLFEMGFLTHDEDRRILASEKGQKQTAERLAKAIQKYRLSLGKK